MSQERGASGPWTFIIALSAFFLVIVLLVGGAVALRLGPFARPPSTPGPSTSASASVSPSATTQPTSQPTATVGPTTPTASPSPSPSTTSQPTQTASSPPQPTDATGLPGTPIAELLTHIPDSVLASCSASATEAPALAGVDCASENGAVTVSYAVYPDSESMYAAYNEIFHLAEIDADSGRCYEVDGQTISATPNKWPAEHGYSVAEQPVGRYLCLEVGDGFDVYWTDERFDILVIAQASADNLDRLVRFWLNEAGPVP